MSRQSWAVSALGFALASHFGHASRTANVTLVVGGGGCGMGVHVPSSLDILLVASRVVCAHAHQRWQQGSSQYDHSQQRGPPWTWS